MTQNKQELYQTAPGLFKTLNEKFKPEHNKTILSCQYHKLSRQAEETAEWMHRLRMKVAECKYKESD